MELLRVKKLKPTAVLPDYMSVGASGCDLTACLDADIEIAAGARAMISTGIAIEIPPGFEGQVRPRSGLAFKYGLSVLNAPGTIDCDYRGELKVLLINLGSSPVVISHGQRIAQLVVQKFERVRISEVSDLSETLRGGGGFGSTGVRREDAQSMSVPQVK